MVDHPAHYGGADNPYEVIKVIDAWQLDFALGNAVKYIARAKHKGSELEDLKKARWYLDHAIEQLERDDRSLNKDIIHLMTCDSMIACGVPVQYGTYFNVEVSKVNCRDCLKTRKNDHEHLR